MEQRYKPKKQSNYQRERLQDIDTDFMDKTAEPQAIKTKIDKCDCIKLIRFCTVKKTFNKIKRHLKEWEKIVTKQSHLRKISQIRSTKNNKSNNSVMKSKAITGTF